MADGDVGVVDRHRSGGHGGRVEGGVGIDRVGEVDPFGQAVGGAGLNPVLEGRAFEDRSRDRAVGKVEVALGRRADGGSGGVDQIDRDNGLSAAHPHHDRPDVGEVGRGGRSRHEIVFVGEVEVGGGGDPRRNAQEAARGGRLAGVDVDHDLGAGRSAVHPDSQRVLAAGGEILAGETGVIEVAGGGVAVPGDDRLAARGDRGAHIQDAGGNRGRQRAGAATGEEVGIQGAAGADDVGAPGYHRRAGAGWIGDGRLVGGEAVDGHGGRRQRQGRRGQAGQQEGQRMGAGRSRRRLHGAIPLWPRRAGARRGRRRPGSAERRRVRGGCGRGPALRRSAPRCRRRGSERCRRRACR